MLTLPYIPTPGCSAPPTECWPCTFKQLWFHDVPFLLLPDAEVNSLALSRRLHRAIHSFIEANILDPLISRMVVSFALRMRQINKEIFRSVFSSKSITSLRMKSRCTISSVKQERSPPASLSSIPAELRLKIFDYITNDASMNVVGYRQGARDAFYFKERGTCPIALTCKQFHQEALEAYFKNLSVNIKSASPSDFSGDMSSFGAARFRDRLKRVSIADGDGPRRSRICSAFKNARIEYNDKYGSGARKGAYYFG